MGFSQTTYWLILALLLAGLEMFTGTFYLLAVASGMMTGAALAWLGASLSVQIVLAAVAALVAVGFLTRWRKNHLPSPPPSAEMEIGRQVYVVARKDARHLRVQYRGAEWDGELVSDAQPGLDHYFIVAMRGSVLILHQNQPSES